jgi:hypothetical protein
LAFLCEMDLSGIEAPSDVLEALDGSAFLADVPPRGQPDNVGVVAIDDTPKCV